MSKKLIKTAKQQFEERLEHFNLMQEWKNQHSEGRIGKDLSGEGVVIFVHESDEDGYSEYHYPSFSELRDDSNFVQNCLKEFSCGSDEFILSIVRWFAYDSTENPFDAVDIYFPADTFRRPSSHEFEDIYEEVPDVRIITAKEQWEKDSKGAEVVQELTNGSIYKVAVTDGSITFFVYQDGGEYFREIYPSFEELRKDVNFVMAYLLHVRATHDKDVDYALAWLQGGEYTMSKVSLLDIYEVEKCIDHLCYHDKEEPTEKLIVKNELKDEMNVLREKMVGHIIELCEQGMTVNVDSLTKWIALGWEDNSFVYTEDIKDLFVKKAGNGEWAFCYTSYSNGRSDEYPFKYLSVETLQIFIEAMQ